MRKVLGGLGLAAMIVATGIGMVKVSAGNDGYYKELSKPKANGEVYVWVSLRDGRLKRMDLLRVGRRL